jgi:hypothetical protein
MLSSLELVENPKDLRYNYFFLYNLARTCCYVYIVKVIEIKYKKEATILNNLFIMNALS